MNPPPPRFPAGGCTTASANPVATAASTALPPACIISTPAREANSCTLTTIPCCAWIGSVEAATNCVALIVRAAISSKINDLCRNRMNVEAIQECGYLRLADGGKQSQINGVYGARPRPTMVSKHTI